VNSVFHSLRGVLLKPRKLQFSLAAVLIGVTIAIVGFGYYKWLFEREEVAPPLTPLPLHIDG
jgi:hypothetical protein